MNVYVPTEVCIFKHRRRVAASLKLKKKCLLYLHIMIPSICSDDSAKLCHLVALSKSFHPCHASLGSFIFLSSFLGFWHPEESKEITETGFSGTRA